MIKTLTKSSLVKFPALVFLTAAMNVFLLMNSHSMSQIRDGVHDANNQKLNQIKKQIEEASIRASQFENAALIISAEISKIQQQLIKSAASIQEKEEHILTIEATLRDLQQRKLNLEKSLKNKNFEMASTLGAMQRLSTQKTSLVAFRPNSAIEMLRTTSLLKVILPDLKNRAESLEADLDQLAIIRTDIELENIEMRQALTALVISNNDIDELLEKRVAKQKELEYSTRAERDKLKKFAKNAKNLQQLIEKIENEIQARERAARLAQNNLKDRPDIASIAPPSASLSFASAKGKLPLPARGNINQTFGQILTSGQRSNGISIQTRSGATVIAPHDGRIVFAGKFRTYGQLLIIAHGEGYHTLLAGMENINGIVGQWILKGEPVGQMSTDNDLSNSRQKLYVEFRRNGKPINPTPWIMASNRRR